MGTSASSKGPASGSPLVPPWADAKPGKPLPPTPQGPRFQSFRTSLGRFVRSGDRTHLRRSLGEYARTATGGSTVGPRRFGSMSTAGGALFAVVNDLRQGGTGQAIAGVDLSSLNGKDVDFAIQEIVAALAGGDGDADKIGSAMQEALSECLEGMDEFDSAAIDDGMLVDMMVCYMRECVYGQVVMDSGRAFQGVEDAQQVVQAERELHALVDSVVDKHMRPLFANGVSTLAQTDVRDVQLKAVAEVWVEWEGYEP